MGVTDPPVDLGACEICDMTATKLAREIRTGQLSACETMDAFAARIERVNVNVNAIVTLTLEQARERARDADEQYASKRSLGPLHGLPVAHKDLTPTAGVRTTFGSLTMRDHVPQQDSLIVERIREAGAIMVGKTNTPEFGAGSQTYNAVFGSTKNPYDLSKTCGGSSGGAAAALAARMLPIADGSDMGGSLRNPAAFCNVVGLRPSPGRVPTWPTDFPQSTLPVEGPMARTVEDVAMLLSAMAGPDPRSPLSLPDDGASFREPLERDFSSTRVALSADFGGQVSIVDDIQAAVRDSGATFESLGCDVAEDTPDFTGADQSFKAWRAWLFAGLCGPLLADHRAQMKDTVVWNTEQGLRLTSGDLLQAERGHTALFRRTQAFFAEYEFLLLPVTQVMPFDVELEYPGANGSATVAKYLDWMRSCYYVTMTGHPAISVPCGFDTCGLPIGLQIVGRRHDDFGVLQLAYAFQQSTQCWRRAPTLTTNPQNSHGALS